MNSNKKVFKGENAQCQYQFEVGFTQIGSQTPYFSITGETWELGKAKIDRNLLCCGALTIGDYIPSLSFLDKYHLMSIKEPMHYVANSLYHASNRDYNGLLKNEKRQLRNGKTGQLVWELKAVDVNTGACLPVYELKTLEDANTIPTIAYKLEYLPCYLVGKGKTPDLVAARASAVWPEAELEDFTKENLIARLPVLLKQFKKAVESIGLIFPSLEEVQNEKQN